MTYSTPLTLGTTYYNCPDEMLKFVDNHLDYVDHLIIVDDGSKLSQKCVFYLDAHPKISLYSLKEDLGFNSHGCRNLVAKMCETDWLLFLDIDRYMPKESLLRLREHLPHLDKNTRYSFKAHFLEWNRRVHDSVNDYLISTNTFFSVGGYDEEFVGIRDGDRIFFSQLEHTSDFTVLFDVDMKLERTSSLSYNQEEILKSKKFKATSEKKRLINKAKARKYKIEPDKPIIQFEFERYF